MGPVLSAAVLGCCVLKYKTKAKWKFKRWGGLETKWFNKSCTVCTTIAFIVLLCINSMANVKKDEWVNEIFWCLWCWAMYQTFRQYVVGIILPQIENGIVSRYYFSLHSCYRAVYLSAARTFPPLIFFNFPKLPSSWSTVACFSNRD